MGKTHEALERAEKRHMERIRAASREPLQKAVTSTLAQTSVRKNKNRYKDIKNDLLTRESDGSIKSVLFINTISGGKSSDHAKRFAASLAEDSRLKVAIVDLNLWTLSLQEVFKVDRALGLSELFLQNGKKAFPIKKVGPENLYMVSLEGDHFGLEDLFESGEFDQFLNNMGERFDYLILDAPGIASFQQCRILCSKVDAVVLVLKSGKIARQIALNAKKYIENSEDKLLGVVINKTSTYQQQLVKAVVVVVAICLILIVGIILGNSQLKLRETGSSHYYKDVIPNIKSETIKSEKASNLAQMKHKVKTETISDGAFADVPKEKIDMQIKTADEQSHDVQKTEGMPAGKEIEKPMPSQGASPDEKDRGNAGKSKTIAIEEGDNLFRIILRAYGTYNDKLVRLVLSENPEITSPQQIVVGRVIKLPEVK